MISYSKNKVNIFLNKLSVKIKIYSSPVVRTKRDPVEPVMVRLGYIFTFFSGSSLVNKPNET